jgi:hypothetical protein
MIRQDEERVKTDDMALATVMRLRDVDMELELSENDRHSRRAIWVMESTQEVLDIVEEFKYEAVRVEPKRFMIAVRSVREELYSFLGIVGKAAPEVVESS